MRRVSAQEQAPTVQKVLYNKDQSFFQKSIIFVWNCIYYWTYIFVLRRSVGRNRLNGVFCFENHAFVFYKLKITAGFQSYICAAFINQNFGLVEFARGAVKSRQIFCSLLRCYFVVKNTILRICRQETIKCTQKYPDKQIKYFYTQFI